MAEITKYNVYLSEQQAHKVDLLSMTTGREPEEIINDAVYGYLAIADPFAEDSDRSPSRKCDLLSCLPTTEDQEPLLRSLPALRWQ